MATPLVLTKEVMGAITQTRANIEGRLKQTIHFLDCTVTRGIKEWEVSSKRKDPMIIFEGTFRTGHILDVFGDDVRHQIVHTFRSEMPYAETRGEGGRPFAFVGMGFIVVDGKPLHQW